MKSRQKDVVIGMILGDAYLQKTGKQNARLRLEHGISQKAFLEWKISLLKNYFQSKLQMLIRENTIWKKTYQYVRIQSLSSSELGKLQRIFYKDSKKIIPNDFYKIFTSQLSLAIWFMDDGYYYHRDKIAYIYIPNYDKESKQHLLSALRINFNLHPQIKQKTKGHVLIFSVSETEKLIGLIKHFIIPSMQYKISLDPVSTERNSFIEK